MVFAIDATLILLTIRKTVRLATAFISLQESLGIATFHVTHHDITVLVHSQQAMSLNHLPHYSYNQ